MRPSPEGDNRPQAGSKRCISGDSSKIVAINDIVVQQQREDATRAIQSARWSVRRDVHRQLVVPRCANHHGLKDPAALLSSIENYLCNIELAGKRSSDAGRVE